MIICKSVFDSRNTRCWCQLTHKMLFYKILGCVLFWSCLTFALSVLGEPCQNLAPSQDVADQRSTADVTGKEQRARWNSNSLKFADVDEYMKPRIGVLSQREKTSPPPATT